MTKKIEYAILAAFVALLWAIVKAALPDFPGTADALLGLAMYVLAKLGVEVIGKPALRRFFPRMFIVRHSPPE